MTKSEEIQAKNSRPIEVGDRVVIIVPYSYVDVVKEGKGKKATSQEVTKNGLLDVEGIVTDINGKNFKVDIYDGSRIPREVEDFIKVDYNGNQKYAIANEKYVKRTYYDCGANPFVKEKRRINFYNQDLSSLLMKAGYGKTSDDYSKFEPKHIDKADDGTYGGVNFNPFIIDANGKRQHYQRELVWTLEQKQLLIESIYQEIEIGKFLFRYNSWSKLEKEMKESGHGHSFDCVDGRQRFFAILHFIQNEYPDSHGNYWNDLSLTAQRRFLGYANLSYGELSESATDEDVIDNFLMLNHSGQPMSPEHIAFVQSINVGKS